jgi:hypothetical protein
MVIFGRSGMMIVAPRHKGKGLFSARDNQDDDLIVARDGGRPGPRLRSMAARRR